MPSEYQLSRIWLKNFKNLLLGGDGLQVGALNVLIGPNGSGKSNLVRVLDFLKKASAPEVAESQRISAFESSLISLGHYHILDSSIKMPESVHFLFGFSRHDNRHAVINYEFELFVQNSRSIGVFRESLKEASLAKKTSAPFVFYTQSDNAPNGSISYFENEKKEEIQTARLDNLPLDRLTLSIIPEALEGKGLTPNLTPIYKVRRQLLEAFSGWRFYNANDMNLKIIRESEPKIGPSDVNVSPSGENMPIVFHNLYQDHIDFEDQINDAIRSILPATRKIRTLHSGRLRLTIEWHMEGMTEPLYLSDMSDGSVRMLCWAIILLSPEPPSLLVIDEPEIGLHPAWMKTLADWIKAAAEKTQVILTTHSPDLLDHFTDCLQDILCFKYNGHHHFTPERLSETVLGTKIKDGWELGDLYRIGDPAIGGWPW